MKKLTVCGTDISDFTLILSADPQPAEKKAAEFLQRVIKGSCGVNLNIGQTKAEHNICIGTREPSETVKFDGFRIASDSNDLYLDGNIPRGTLFASYELAEKYLGYRLFADDCEVIPTDGSEIIPAGLEIIDNPVFSARRTTCHQHVSSAEFSSHSRLNDCVPCGEEYGGIEPLTGECHNFDRLCPPSEYFDEHPEYFSYVIDKETGEGERKPAGNFAGGAQLCLSNPDVIRIVTENILKKLRENPDTKLVEISQCDNTRYCQCEKCAAIDAEEESHAGTLLRFVNAIAEGIEKEFPNVLIRTFAYKYSRTPPKITKAHPNVLIRYCTIEACSRHALNDPNCSINSAVYGKEMAEWGRIAKQVSVWNYITNWCSFNAPFPILISLRENARFFADCGTLHYFAECNPSDNAGGVYPQLKSYLIGKLLWNPYMSEEEYERHICEFLKAYYGPGWHEIGKYIKMEHDVTANKDIKCFAYVDIGAISCECTPYILGYSNFIRSRYTPVAYQPVYPDHPLTEFCEHTDEAFALFDRAYALAETDVQRFHIRRSRCSLNYADLFIKSRVKDKLTPDERAVYEAACAEFLEDVKTYNFRYNVWTNNFANR